MLPTMANKLVLLPKHPPACFRDAEQWRAYKHYADFLTRHGKERQDYTYCTDCTPEYRDAMIAEHRCAHPGTTFIRIHQIIVGRRPHGTGR